MGIQAPSNQENYALFLTALLSDNHPLILSAVFFLTLILSFFISKKNLLVSLIISLGATLATGLYFIFTYIEKLYF